MASCNHTRRLSASLIPVFRGFFSGVARHEAHYCAGRHTPTVTQVRDNCRGAYRGAEHGLWLDKDVLIEMRGVVRS